MRRSICICEPNNGLAGATRTWKFIYTTATALPKGTKLKFDLGSKGRELDWEIPSANLKKSGNVIYAKLENGKVIQGKEIDLPDSFVPQYEFILPSEMGIGKTITFIVGSQNDKEFNTPKNGTRCQTNAQRRRTFLLYVDPTGKGKYTEPEQFSLDIRGNVLNSIKIMAPSFAQRNKRFDVIVRFEDEYGNLTSYAPEDTMVELSHEHLRENLNWKLFVPETGFIALPNLYFNDPGVYTIVLTNSKTKETFKSSPIRCFADNPKNLFWGLLHGESDRMDSTDNVESCLRHFRDERGVNFYGISAFENQEETSNETWKLISQNVLDFDENERFNTFLGCQWVGTPKSEGVRHLLYLKDGKQILRKKDPKYTSLSKIYKSFTPKELISIPTFTMGKGKEYDFSNFDPLYERVVEIYNAWGSSECTAKEGNTRPISIDGKKGVVETVDGSIQKALLKNYRFGFVAGGLDDRGFYDAFYESDQIQYSPGLTAIIAAEQTKASIAEALYNRSCYATTGERMIIGFHIAGNAMGTETSNAVKPGLQYNRHISGHAAGTTKLEKIEIIRNGKVIHTIKPEGYAMEFTYDDTTALDKVCVDAKDKNPPFVFYYIRVTQEDGHMAWSSPIWIDFIKDVPKKLIPKAAVIAPKKLLLEELDDDLEDFDDDFDDEDDEDEV